MKDVKKGLQLVRYGASFKVNVGMGILFFVLGIIMEVIWMTDGRETEQLASWGFDMGAVFLASSVMIPVQLFLSVDVAQLAQTSPLKKKLQTDVAGIVSFAGSMAVFTLILLMRLVRFLIRPELGSEAFGGLVSSVFFICFCLIYATFLYKFFVLSLVIMVGTVFCYNVVASCLAYSGVLLSLPRLPLAVQIPLCFVLIAAAAAVNYGISLALYRRPFSKNAFGAAMRPYM